jgi:hypothetical protein
MGDLRDLNPVGLASVVTAAALVVVVAGVGALGLWARYVNTWRSFFIMERVVETATPVVLALTAALVVSAIGTVAYLR